jgi:predicted amidophosphoribosyltransferase
LKRTRLLFFHNCGADAHGAKFCPECGEKLAVTAKCPKCSTEFSPGTKFCPECGNKIA